jgi:hypothetical protein
LFNLGALKIRDITKEGATQNNLEDEQFNDDKVVAKINDDLK